MSNINPQKEKYFTMYVELAKLVATQSTATRRQVGAVVVLPTGLVGLGWNGMPAGFDNTCECPTTNKTKPEVIHAERNALDKLTREGVSPKNGILFVTTAPCMECAKSIAAIGITHVIYSESYHCDAGLEFLIQSGVDVTFYQKGKQYE